MTDGSGGWAPIAAVSAAVWQYFEANPMTRLTADLAREFAQMTQIWLADARNMAQIWF